MTLGEHTIFLPIGKNLVENGTKLLLCKILRLASPICTAKGDDSINKIGRKRNQSLGHKTKNEAVVSNSHP